MVRSVRAEYNRRGGFLRIFPSPESWKRYASFLGAENYAFLKEKFKNVLKSQINFNNFNFMCVLDPLTGLLNLGNQLTQTQVNPHNFNLLLHQQLFPELDMTPTDRLPRYERALVQGHRSSLTVPTLTFNSHSSEKESKSI